MPKTKTSGAVPHSIRIFLFICKGEVHAAHIPLKYRFAQQQTDCVPLQMHAVKSLQLFIFNRFNLHQPYLPIN
jgi:hypothetical protein